MKRGTDTRNECATGKPCKQTRTESWSSPAAISYFADEIEVKASALADSEGLDETGHILGQVFMQWPTSKQVCKIQLATESGALDVVFKGPGVEKLDFLPKDKVKIALKGGRKEAKKAGSPHTLSFKLEFPGGAIVKFLASEKRIEEKLVDLFAEEEDEGPEDDWYHPSLEEHPVHDIVQVSHTPPFTADVPASDPPEFQELSTDPIILVDHSHKDAEPIPDDGNISQNPKDKQLQTNANHYIGTSHTEISRTAPEKVFRPFDADHNVNSSTSHVPPAVGPPPNPQLHRVQVSHKDKRIKKRDTRYPRRPIESSTSDAVPSNMQGSSDSNAQKRLQKKAQKRAEFEAMQAEAHLSTPPSDPIPDLVPGFHSDKGGFYTPVGRVISGKSYSLVGVVADVGVIKTTKTGERCKSFVLVDPSQYEVQGLTVNTFVSQSDEEILPSATLNQVLLLRNVKVKDFQGKLQGTCYKDSFQWCGYNSTQGKHFYTITGNSSSTTGQGLSKSQPCYDAFFKPAAAELEYFVKLSDWWRALKEAEQKAHSHSHDSNVTTHIVAPKRRRLQTINEMEYGTYVNCVVEILKVWKGDLYSEIYVTDYSENKYLEHRTVTGAGLLGRRTLKITLWDGDHTMADELEVHHLYVLKNLRLKKKESSRWYLEGTMGFQDRGIYKLAKDSDQENRHELLMRKKEYEENPLFSRFELNDNIPEPVQQCHTVAPNERVTVLQTPGIVECSHMDQKRSTIEEVQRCNLCPNKFRLRARIIEYYPRRIKNFVVVECKSCDKILNDSYRLCPDCGDLQGKSTTVTYQFSFRLADESGGELNVGVSGEDADEFLTGLNAEDARDDDTALKSRLMPLLGHLDKWHEGFDEAKVQQGPWLDLCVNSWVAEVAEGSETLRLYKLFGCRLRQR